jgi:hypothetical protein
VIAGRYRVERVIGEGGMGLVLSAEHLVLGERVALKATELGRYAIAANAYDRFLEEAPPDAPNRGEVEKALKEVVPRVGTLAISVSGSPKTVTIDGQNVELVRIKRIRVMPGRHDVVAVSESGARAEQSVNVGAGATVALALAPDSPEPSKTTTAPVTTEEPPEKPKHQGPPPQRSALPWVVGGVGVASLIASGVLYSMRGSSESKLKSECIGKICPDSSDDDIKRANRLGALSAITFGIGVAGVGTAIYLIVKGPSSEPVAEKQQAFQVYVTGAPNAASATFAGRF